MANLTLPRPGLRSSVFAITVLVLAWLLFGFLAVHPIWDVDVFWHIKAGQWIVDNLSLPSTDIFSAVDPARPWYTFQWLYEVLVYGLDAWSGLTGLRVVHAAVTASALTICLGWFWHTRSLAHGLVIMGLLAVIFADRMRVRPDVFNLLFTCLLFPVLVKKDKLARADLILVAVVSAIWANMHAGGALLAPILLGARLSGRGMELLVSVPDPRKLSWSDWKDKLAMDLVVAVVCAGVMLAMPGFLRGNIQAFTQLGPSERFIPEWMSTYEFLFKHAKLPHEFVAGWAPLAGFCLLLLYTLGLSWRKGWAFSVFPWVGLALTMPMVYLSLEHIRFLWLGLMPWAVLAYEIDLARNKRRWLAVAGWWVATAVGLACLVGNAHYHLYQRNLGLASYADNLYRDLEPGEFPEAAGEFMAEAGLQGRILNHAAWGGYLLYKLWPNCTVYTDGRGNFTDLETHILVTIEMTGIRRDAVNAAYGRTPFEMVIHPDPFPVHDYSRWDWVLIYKDRRGAVFMRNTRRNQENFRRVIALYDRLGLDLDLNYRTGEVYEFERRIRQFWGRQQLAHPRLVTKLQVLEVRATAADSVERKRANVALAIIHFDAGMYQRTRFYLKRFFADQKQRHPRAQLLMALAFLADGYPLDSLIILRCMEAQLKLDPILAKQIRGESRVMFNLVFAHTVEYAMTIPHNRYRWALDGGKWLEFE